MKFNLYLKDTHLDILDELKEKHSISSNEELVKRYVKSKRMFSVLLPLCTLPLICMVTASILETPIPFWYLAMLFVYNMIKSICGSLGLCYQNVKKSLPYLVVIYFFFLVADIILIPYFILNFVQGPVLFVAVFIIIASMTGSMSLPPFSVYR